MKHPFLQFEIKCRVVAHLAEWYFCNLKDPKFKPQRFGNSLNFLLNELFVTDLQQTNLWKAHKIAQGAKN